MSNKIIDVWFDFYTGELKMGDGGVVNANIVTFERFNITMSQYNNQILLTAQNELLRQFGVAIKNANHKLNFLHGSGRK